MSRYDDAELRKLQLLELDVLKEVDAVCRVHGITYFLDGGSALGAMRHGGFIPWDDDIDIGMMRDDYERFLQVAPAALGSRYTVSEPEGNPRQSALFAKVWRNDTKFYADETLRAGIKQGVGIDVFPYDVLSADEKTAKRQLSKSGFVQRMLYLYHSPVVVVPHGGALGALEKAACRVAHAVLKLFTNHEALMKRYRGVAQDGRSAPGEWVSCLSYPTYGPYRACDLVPVRMVAFEQVELPVPGGVERVLDAMYADWRELPPESERRQHAPTVLDLGE